MKKLLSTVLVFIVLLLNSGFYVEAGHQHTDACYEMQGEHIHSGNAKSGGDCYAIPVYHSHNGDTIKGGNCYKTAIYHAHNGNANSGGACYSTPIYHSHIGNMVEKGGCYNTPVYHTHIGNPAEQGGCYTNAVVCGADITSQKVNISCNVTTGGVLKTETWPCECGGTVTQTCYWLKFHPECKDDHKVYYEYQCNLCGKFSTSGHIGTHTGFQYVYSCSACGTTYHTLGKCTKVQLYSLGCDKSDNYVEKYELSCGKNQTTVDGYRLSCTKNEKTIEGYQLSCNKTEKSIDGYRLSCTKKESAGEKVLVCQTEEVFDFEIECGLMSDGVWAKITTISLNNPADEPFSWDGGNSWSKSDKNIFQKDGTYFVALKDNEGHIKAKKLDIDTQSSNYAVVTDCKEYLTETELKEMIKVMNKEIEEEEVDMVGYVQAKPAETQSPKIIAEELSKEEIETKESDNTLARAANVIAFISLFCSSGLVISVLLMKRKKR